MHTRYNCTRPPGTLGVQFVGTPQDFPVPGKHLQKDRVSAAAPLQLQKDRFSAAAPSNCVQTRGLHLQIYPIRPGTGRYLCRCSGAAAENLSFWRPAAAVPLPKTCFNVYAYAVQCTSVPGVQVHLYSHTGSSLGTYNL